MHLFFVTFKAPRIELASVSALASGLGGHAVLHNVHTRNLLRCPVRFGTLDPDQFVNVLSQHNLSVLGDNIDAEENEFCDVLYECARNSQSQNYVLEDDSEERWEWLLKENDQSQAWRAINWRDEVEVTPAASTVASPPTDEDFKDHFEST